MTNPTPSPRFSPRAEDASGIQYPVNFNGTQSSMGLVSRNGKSTQNAASSVAHMMADLDRVQSEQQTFQRKIDLEKKKSGKIDLALVDQREQLQYYRDVTKSGRIVKDDEMLSKKMIGKLEYQVAQARNKLSSVRKENQGIKINIIEMRKEKMFQFGILNNLKKEIANNKKACIDGKDEINIVNNKKQRTEVELMNMKNQLFTEMDNFGNELEEAKAKVIDTQHSILDGIREKFQTTFIPYTDDNKKRTYTEEQPGVDFIAVERDKKLKEYLNLVNVSTLEELIISLQTTEEIMFNKYNDIQELTQDSEEIIIHNKHLESSLESEMLNLEKLQSSSDNIRLELKDKKKIIQSSIEINLLSFNKNMEILNSCKKELETMLRNFALDEDVTDQALMTTGITDRNIPEFLGQIEQRIDELIQFMKAAKHEALNRADFGKVEITAGGAGAHASGAQGNNVNDRRNSRNSEGSSGHTPYNMPVLANLPSFADNEDDDEVTNTNSATAGAGVVEDRVQPIDVHKLKKMMDKKLNNSITVANASAAKATENNNSNNNNNNNNNRQLGTPTKGISESKDGGSRSATPINVSPIARASAPHTPSGGSRPGTSGSVGIRKIRDTAGSIPGTPNANPSTINDSEFVELRMPATIE
jgi:hypothetical protein